MVKKPKGTKADKIRRKLAKIAPKDVEQAIASARKLARLGGSDPKAKAPRRCR